MWSHPAPAHATLKAFQYALPFFHSAMQISPQRPSSQRIFQLKKYVILATTVITPFAFAREKAQFFACQCFCWHASGSDWVGCSPKVTRNARFWQRVSRQTALGLRKYKKAVFIFYGLGVWVCVCPQRLFFSDPQRFAACIRSRKIAARGTLWWRGLLQSAHRR